jgi:ferrous iron transport protein A
MRILEQLQPGEKATIQAIHADQGLYQRLAALGFHVGKPIEVIRRASFNGPLHVRLGSTDVVMRTTDAKHIELSRAA